MIAKNFAKTLVDDYVVFDLETTGFYPDSCEIIEIGALKYKNNTLVDEFNVLIKPSTPIPDTITSITGITNEMVSTAESINTVLPKFLDFIEDLTLIAHNSGFDLSFLEQNIQNQNLPMITNQNIDTVYLSRKYLKTLNLENNKLETLKKYFNLDFGSHRSLEDCKTTNYVYQYCKKEALVQN